MVSSHLKKSDVIWAVEELERQGKAVSVKKIREYLGSGSLTTISKYYKEYQSERDSFIQSDIDMTSLLSEIDAEHLASFLDKEHPQVIALVLSFLSPSFVAEILGHLDVLDDILQRMRTLQSVDEKVIQTIAQTLKIELAAFRKVKCEQRGGDNFVSLVQQQMKKQGEA